MAHPGESQTFEIGGRPVGGSAPALIIAEAGSNHDARLDRAHELVDAAAAAGVDAIKFQLFEARRLYPRTAGRCDYLGLETSIYDLIQAMELPPEWLAELRHHSREVGLAFLASPFHEAAVELLAEHVDAFKIASYELTHEPLLEAVAARGLPVILSTGASTLEECRRALTVLRGAGCEELVLLQCTARYPTEPEDADVRALVSLREELGVPTGFSDHTRDPLAAPSAAAALGACVIEKHFTLDRSLPGPDHAFAVEPDELTRLVEAVRGVEAVLGDGQKEVRAVEEELRGFARRALFTTRAVAAGEAFGPRNTAALRRGQLAAGLEPARQAELFACVAVRDLAEEAPLEAGDLALLEEAHAGVEPLLLRAATEADSELLLEWANDPETRTASHQRAPIPRAEHEAWFAGVLADPTRRLFVAQVAGEAVGSLRLDETAGTAEVSVVLAPHRRGRGLGRRLLGLALRRAALAGLERLDARVLPENVASRRAFEAAGFELVGETEVDGRRVLRYGARLGA